MSSGSPLSVLAAAAEVPLRAALVHEGIVRSYADLAAQVAVVMRELAASAASRERVAFVAHGRPDTLVTVLALLELGVPFVPLHPRLTGPELASLRAAAAPVRWIDVDLGHRAPRAAGSPRPTPVARPSSAGFDPAAPCAILFTSGTTGHAKGAVLSRGAFVASAAASAANLGWRDDDRWLLCMPVCHAGGLSIVTRCLQARRTIVLHERFDPAAVLASVRADGVTLLSVVPTMLKALLAADRSGDLARLRAILVGGAAAPQELLDEGTRRGVQALATYGLTEACSQVTAHRLTDPPAARRGSGPALAGIHVSVRADSGDPVAAGAVGRIHVRGPVMMDGYLGEAGGSASLAASSPSRGGDRWFDTGDLGAADEAGNLHVHARRTDLIVTGGENVYPAEVEHALEACPGVRRALVFGVQDETWGEIVAAAIVLEREPRPAEAALHAAAVGRLASHKRPRRVCFPDALPLASADKLDRAEGRRRFTTLLRPWDLAPSD